MRKHKGHTLSIVLILMMMFLTMITYHYSHIKTRMKTYQNILNAYKMSDIEMRCLSYIQYVLVHDLPLKSFKEEHDQIEFITSEHEIECLVKKGELQIHFIIDVDFEEKKIKSMKFV